MEAAARPAADRAPVRDDWDDLIDGVIAGHRLRSLYQPIVDLQRRVVTGYEALTRVDADVAVGPDRWFAEAAARGRLGELEALAVRSALSRRDRLPPNCFLTVNLDPESLLERRVMDEFDHLGRLDGIVVEVTEHRPMTEPAAQRSALERLRAAGAMIAVDDAGTGHSGLQQILDLRPAILKLDRALVEGIDGDEAKVALVEMIGLFADRIDAWLLAEGVETVAEARRLDRLGVPLVQGYWFSRPAPPFADLPPSVREELGDAPAGRTPDLAPLVGPVPTVDEVDIARAAKLLQRDGAEHVVVTRADRPVGVLDADGAITGIVSEPLRVNLRTTPAEVARRLATRRPVDTSAPVLVLDNAGRLIGAVTVRRLLAELAVTTA